MVLLNKVKLNILRHLDSGNLNLANSLPSIASLATLVLLTVPSLNFLTPVQKDIHISLYVTHQPVWYPSRSDANISPSNHNWASILTVSKTCFRPGKGTMGRTHLLYGATDQGIKQMAQQNSLSYGGGLEGRSRVTSDFCLCSIWSSIGYPVGR